MGVYNHADMLIVDNDAMKHTLLQDIPQAEIQVLDFVQDRHESLQPGIRFMLDQEARRTTVVNTVECLFIDREAVLLHEPATSAGRVSQSEEASTAQQRAEIMRWVSNVKSVIIPDKISCINSALRQMDSDFCFVAGNDIVVHRKSYDSMLFCLQAHHQNAIVVPSSNIILKKGMTIDLLNAYYDKHYTANFGNWHEVRNIPDYCFMIRSNLLKDIGFLDERFATLHYAGFDLCVRAFQAGYRTLMPFESFVYFRKQTIDPRNCLQNDRRILLEKWAEKGMSFLEHLQG
jgi:hypothetical protein